MHTLTPSAERILADGALDINASGTYKSEKHEVEIRRCNTFELCLRISRAGPNYFWIKLTLNHDGGSPANRKILLTVVFCAVAGLCVAASAAFGQEQQQAKPKLQIRHAIKPAKTVDVERAKGFCRASFSPRAIDKGPPSVQVLKRQFPRFSDGKGEF